MNHNSKLNRHYLQKNEGNLLIITLITVAILSVLVGSAFQLTSQNARMTARAEASMQAQALADGAMEMMFAQWRHYVSNNMDMTSGRLPTRDELRFIEEGVPTNDLRIAQAFNVNGTQYSIVRYQVLPLDRDGDVMENDDAMPENSGGAGFAAMVNAPDQPTSIYRYAAEVTVIREGAGLNSMPIAASVLRTFEVTTVALTDYFAFFEHRLEAHPGALQGVFGKLGGNENIYYSSTNLTIWDKVSAAGTINNGFAPGDGTRKNSKAGNSRWGAVLPANETPNLSDPAQLSWNPSTRESLRSAAHFGQSTPSSTRSEVLGTNPEILFNDLANPNHAGMGRELIEKPDPNFPDPIEGFRLYNQADVRIIVDSSVPINSPDRLAVYIKDYSDRDRPAKEVAVPRTDPFFAAVAATIVRGSSLNATTNLATQVNPSGNAAQIINDKREAADMHVTSFDMEKLSSLLGSKPDDAIRTNLAAEATSSALPIAGVSAAQLTGSSSVVLGAKNHPNLPSGFNGMVYITDESAERAWTSNASNAIAVKDKSPAMVLAADNVSQVNRSNLEKGIRLVNAGVLSEDLTSLRNPSGSFALASDNPVYVLGDFNTGRQVEAGDAVTGSPTSNNGNDDTGANGDVPSATDVLANKKMGNDRYNEFTNSDGYERKPAMIAADAFNILSNNWSDANSYSDLDTRLAAHTTLNAIVVSGNVPSGKMAADGKINPDVKDKYSGGLENFPRFLETWGGSRHVTFYGSLIQLYRSKFASGNWGNSEVYSAPRRRWYYDNMFREEQGEWLLADTEFGRGRAIHPGKSTYELPSSWSSGNGY